MPLNHRAIVIKYVEGEPYKTFKTLRIWCSLNVILKENGMLWWKNNLIGFKRFTFFSLFPISSQTKTGTNGKWKQCIAKNEYPVACLFVASFYFDFKEKWTDAERSLGRKMITGLPLCGLNAGLLLSCAKQFSKWLIHTAVEEASSIQSHF